MIDTLTQVVQQGGSIIIPMTIGTTGFLTAVGKIIWDVVKTPKSQHCMYHEGLANNITDMKTDIAVMKNDVSWLVADYKRRNGV